MAGSQGRWRNGPATGKALTVANGWGQAVIGATINSEERAKLIDAYTGKLTKVLEA